MGILAEVLKVDKEFKYGLTFISYNFLVIRISGLRSSRAFYPRFPGVGFVIFYSYLSLFSGLSSCVQHQYYF